MMAGADWLNLHFDREREGRHVTLHVAHFYTIHSIHSYYISIERGRENMLRYMFYREEGRRVRGYITIHSIHSYYILIERGRGGEEGGEGVRRHVLLH